MKIKPGHIILFGSGEMSPTGRKIHEDFFKKAQFYRPVKIGILETPTGFEVNAIHTWPARMQTFFEKSLKNFEPQVTRIRAWRRDGNYSTNDPTIVNSILEQEYLYAGAGSPSYVVTHLKNSLAYSNLIKAHQEGIILCLGSATAVACSRFCLPVYEIFKAGHDLFWLDGLDLFKRYNLNLTIMPHWNNSEGEDFDTSRCWMGKGRFEKLRNMLPKETVILGVDEQTALIIDPVKQEAQVVGIGTATIMKNGNERIFLNGRTFSFGELR